MLANHARKVQDIGCLDFDSCLTKQGFVNRLRKVHVRTLPNGYSWRKVIVSGGAPPARTHHAAAQFREMMCVE